MATKKEYTAPRVEEVGTFEKLTQGGSCGGVLDNDFAAGTPFDDVTCS